MTNKAFKKIALILVLAALSALPAAVSAQEGDPAQVPEAFRSTQYPLPRFVSLGSGEAFVRTGPGKKFPVEWVYRRTGLPVEIILEFEHWRKIRDMDGSVGWLHKSLLSGHRTGVVRTEDPEPLYRKSGGGGKLSAYLQRGVIVDIDECDGDWCLVDASGYKGWISQQKLWGVYADEKFKD